HHPHQNPRPAAQYSSSSSVPPPPPSHPPAVGMAHSSDMHSLPRPLPRPNLRYPRPLDLPAISQAAPSHGAHTHSAPM
ncbi:hypothetical protein EC988_009888, partial [Linderina pennispora]